MSDKGASQYVSIPDGLELARVHFELRVERHIQQVQLGRHQTCDGHIQKLVVTHVQDLHMHTWSGSGLLNTGQSVDQHMQFYLTQTP